MKRIGPLAAIGALAVVVVGTPAAAADLGGFELAARAPAIEVILDSGLAPVPSHPLLDGWLPATMATLDTGPLGHGLASTMWPGDLAGHFGTALQQLNQLCSSALPVALPVAGVPPVCEPVPQAVKDQAPALNDPVKAETFAPGGPADAHYPDPPLPGLTMTSHADGSRVDSLARLDGFFAPGVVAVGGVSSRSVTTVAADKAVSEATSELTDVVIGGGLLAVDHVLSTARESTDGAAAVGSGSTVLSGVKLAGLPVRIDDRGVHLTGSSTGALSPLVDALDALVASGGLRIVLTRPEVTTDGAAGSFSAPTVVVRYADADNAAAQQAGAKISAALPALGQPALAASVQSALANGTQNALTVALGGAEASVDASPGFGATGGAGPGEAPIPVQSGSSRSAAGPVSGATVAALHLSSPATGPPAASIRRSGPRLAGSTPLGGFAGLGWGMVVAAVGGALAIGYGIYRLSVGAESRPATRACPTNPHLAPPSCR